MVVVSEVVASATVVCSRVVGTVVVWGVVIFSKGAKLHKWVYQKIYQQFWLNMLETQVKVKSNCTAYQKPLYIRVIFPCKSSNESSIMVIVSEVVASATVVCSRVVGIIVVSWVVVFSKDTMLIKKLHKGSAALLLNIFE